MNQKFMEKIFTSYTKQKIIENEKVNLQNEHWKKKLMCNVVGRIVHKY